MLEQRKLNEGKKENIIVEQDTQDRSRQGAGLTCGEVDVGKKDDVCGDERDELSDADLLFKVDVNHVVISQAAVG